MWTLHHPPSRGCSWLCPSCLAAASLSCLDSLRWMWSESTLAWRSWWWSQSERVVICTSRQPNPTPWVRTNRKRFLAASCNSMHLLPCLVSPNKINLCFKLLQIVKDGDFNVFFFTWQVGGWMTLLLVWLPTYLKSFPHGPTMTSGTWKMEDLPGWD